MSADLRSELRCAQGCDFRAPWTQVVYRCPTCGGLLEVAHDVAALQRTPAAEWKRRFAERRASARLPAASGIWGKKEWVLPELPDADVVSLAEGNNPLLPLPRLAGDLGLGSVDLKQCGVSATGSFKDLGMTVLVSAVKHMRSRGQPVRAVACASTGDTSAALAAYCAAARIPSVVFLPRNKVSLSQLVQPLANAALVLSLDTDFDGCMRIVQEVTKDGSLYLANSMNSLRIEGQKVVAVELCEQLGWDVPDWVVIPGGNLGNASALGKGFELLLALGLISRRPRIAVAQAAKANPLFRAFQRGFQDLTPVKAERTLASAIQIGDPVSIHRAIRVLKAFDGVVEEATESELANAAARADREGAFACPHTGVALAALEKLAARGTIPRGSRVAVISTAHGLKFPDFKVGYHRGELPEVQSRWPNPPLELPATVESVRAALDDRLPRPSIAPPVNASPDNRRRELDRLQAQIATRTSIIHLAHGAVSTIFSLMVFGLAGLFEWGKNPRDYTAFAPPVAIAAAALLTYALSRFYLAYRAHLRELAIFAELMTLRRELKVEDPSALLPP